MKDDPLIIQKTNKLLRVLQQFTSLEDKFQFVECSTVADEARMKGFDDTTHMHYVDEPIKDLGFEGEVELDKTNVTWAMVGF